MDITDRLESYLCPKFEIAVMTLRLTRRGLEPKDKQLMIEFCNKGYELISVVTQTPGASFLLFFQRQTQ
jgi:hypothetical protein